MIYDLNGMHENPKYRENTHLCIHDNNLYEDYPIHWHSAIEVLMPIENNYTVVINSKEYVVNPYELLFVGTNVPHSTIAPTSGRRFFFQIDVSKIAEIACINEILPLIGQARQFTPENAPNIHRKLVKLYEEICEEYYTSEDADNNSDSSDSSLLLSREMLCEPMIYAKFLTMLTLIGKEELDSDSLEASDQLKRKEYAAKMVTACRYIDAHFTDEITLEEVASKVGYSKYHFSRIFKQFTNISFYKFVNQQRIAYAEELLSNPDLSVSKIAIQCGFSSTSSFIRMFKLLKDCTPTDFRELRDDYTHSMNTYINK